MTQKIYSTADLVLTKAFYLLFFLTPLIISPINYELFEFNKMIVVYLLTIIIVVAWLVKMIVAKKVIFRRSFWDLPLLLFLISQVLATIFSLDRHTSLWGYYTRAHGGLMSTISYLLLYWALISNFQCSNEPIHDTKLINCLKAILISGFLVAGYGILEHFGIDKTYWVQDVQNRVFSTFGQPNWLAAYLTTIIFLPLAFSFTSKKSSKSKNFNFLVAGSYLLFTVFYLALLFTKSRSGLLAFGISYSFFWIITFLNSRSRQSRHPTTTVSYTHLTLPTN